MKNGYGNSVMGLLVEWVKAVIVIVVVVVVVVVVVKEGESKREVITSVYI